MTGYSGAPLAKKLGIKSAFRIKLINVPGHYLQLFTDLPAELYFEDDEKPEKDLIHFLLFNGMSYRLLPVLKTQIKPNGIIWISWPKKASKMPTDITEDIIRELAIKNGLVDIKVCAVDETWSGLKLVIPVKDRKSSL